MNSHLLFPSNPNGPPDTVIDPLLVIVRFTALDLVDIPSLSVSKSFPKFVIVTDPALVKSSSNWIPSFPTLSTVMVPVADTLRKGPVATAIPFFE